MTQLQVPKYVSKKSSARVSLWIGASTFNIVLSSIVLSSIVNINLKGNSNIQRKNDFSQFSISKFGINVYKYLGQTLQI